MILKSLHINNIRSYTDERMEFAEGITLISGDVGSGKTTILLAIEFALFGILRGEVPASNLLRHGQDRGFVELTFSIDEQEYVVKRELRKDKNGIKQGPCSLTSNNATEQLTPVELKSRVIEILGYPSNLLSKAKNLVYRYTVFTPQEQMQQIILESSDDRLEVLRKIFCIDHYKTVIDNITMLKSNLRQESRALQMRLEDLAIKTKRREDLTKSVVQLEQEKLILAKQKTSFETQVQALESKQQDLNEHLARIKQKQERLLLKKESVGKISHRRLELDKRLEQFSKLVPPTTPTITPPDAEKLKKVEANIVKVQDKLSQANKKIAVLESTSSSKKSFVADMKGLSGTCPTCHQEIDEKHKHSLIEEQNTAITSNDKELASLQLFITQAKEKLDQLMSKKEELAKQSQEFVLAKTRFEAKQKEFQTSQENVKLIKQELETLTKDLEETQAEVKALEGEVLASKDLEQRAAKLHQEMTCARSEFQKNTSELARTEQSLLSSQQQCKELDEEIARLQEMSKHLQQLQKRVDWLDDFSDAVIAIEMAVFSSLHHEFNQLVINWFDILIDDDTISLSLDAHFSPIVRQNGHDAAVSTLSGGEKTALSLAYRLALNQIINEFIISIHTRDIIILDEPTDGFSSKQLDNMRTVLEQLRMKQIIIVSHESKMEGLVQHSIHVHKEGSSSLSS